MTCFVFPFMSRLYSYFNMGVAKAFTWLMEFEARHPANKPLVYITHPEEYCSSSHYAKRMDTNWKLLAPGKENGFLLRIPCQGRSESVPYQRALTSVGAQRPDTGFPDRPDLFESI